MVESSTGGFGVVSTSRPRAIVVGVLVYLFVGFVTSYRIETHDSSSYLSKFEPVFYNKSEVLHQHRRIRRQINPKSEDENIRLQFHSHGRNFDLKLGIQDNLFHPDLVVENSDGKISYDTSRVLRGQVSDESDSVVHGILGSDGTFDGYLSTEDGRQYYVEPRSTQHSSPSIMYRPEDVVWDGPKTPSCASHDLHLKSLQEGWFRKNETTTGSGAKESATRSRRQKRWAIDPKKKTCMLYLQADHLFYERFGSEEACIDVMTRHIQRVNDIYKSTDFDSDGRHDDVQFMIKRIKVHTQNHTKDSSYRYKGEFQVIKFLELFSEGDYDSFCLAYMFTFRDFEGGTLGLAWTGDLKNAGGVCEKKGHFRGGLKSLNTGIITLLNYGKVVPPSVSYITLAHELAHNLGSPHDPESDKACVPGGEEGNYIMFARATAGDRKNNNRFSPCSLRSILPVLNIKARDIHGCFTEPQESICGNGVVDKGEECDCGWEEDCKESCCFPMRLRPSPHEPPCTLRPQKACSPSQGPCCTGNCTVKFGDKCRDDNGCRDASYCDGTQPFCPASLSKPNKTLCNKEYVCFMGECTGSICLAYGLESCQCSPEPWDSSSKYCDLCCKLPGEGNPCLSSRQWNDPPYDVPDMYAKPGSPCKNYTGYCDAYQTCREIDPSGPLATLRKLLLADEGLAVIADWIDNHWYAVLLGLISLISMMVIAAKFCGKRAQARLRKLTVMHSNVEAIQIQRAYLEDNGHAVVHHAAVRKKIPFRKKVRERSKNRQRRAKERKPELPTTPSKTVTKTGSLWRKKKASRSKARQTELETNFSIPAPPTASAPPVPAPSGGVPYNRAAMPLPPLPQQGSTTAAPVQQQEQPLVALANAPTASGTPVSEVPLGRLAMEHLSPPNSSLSASTLEITHQVNAAIVPHAKDQKRKYRKGHEGRSHPKHKSSKSKSKSGSSSSKQKKTTELKKSSSSTSLGAANNKTPESKSPADGPKPKSSKKNIQVVYSPPFSVKVQVVEAEAKGDKDKTAKPASPSNKEVPAAVAKSAAISPSKSKSSSFLQTRHQKSSSKKTKNPSSELRVLISPYNDDGDINSPGTPGT